MSDHDLSDMDWLELVSRVGSVTMISDDGTTIHVPRARLVMSTIKEDAWCGTCHLEVRFEMLPVTVRVHWFKRLWWWVRRGFWHKRKDEV